jgi:hypothetical protein
MLIAHVYHDKSNNFARKGPLFKDGEPEKNALSVNLMHGWWKSHPIAAVPMTKEEIEAAVKAREEEYEAIKTMPPDWKYVFEVEHGKKVEIVPAEMKEAFESVYMDSKGKIIPPKYSGVYAFRRSSALLGAVALRRKLSLGDFNEIPLARDAQGKVTDKGLPVNVEYYASEYDRVVACTLENFGKSIGLSSVESDWPTIMAAARNLRDTHIKFKKTPITEAEMVRTIGTRGSGQKAFYLLNLDTKYPALHIVDNVINNTTPCSSLDRMQLLKLRDDDKKTQADVAAYLANPKAVKNSQPKRMNDKKLEAVKMETPSRVLKLIIEAIQTDDYTTLTALYGYAVKLDSSCKGFIEFCNAQKEMKDNLTPNGESLPDLVDEEVEEEVVPAESK